MERNMPPTRRPRTGSLLPGPLLLPLCFCAAAATLEMGCAGSGVAAVGDGGHTADSGAGVEAGNPHPPGTRGTITGNVQGTGFSTIGSAWWIGKPAAGSL